MIFVGGTGRSGTTILAKILGKHPDIYVFPKEIRFITDPDGVLSLKSALVDNWSFFQADFAIERFFKLLHVLSKSNIGKYPSVNLKNIAGKKFYSDWKNSYFNEISQFSFKSAWIARASLFRKAFLQFFRKNRFTEFFLKKSFYASPMTEEKFYYVTNRFLSEFFNHVAGLHDKKIVVEHTPSNFLHADSLFKMFPEMKLVHIFRDPRDVVTSYHMQDWGSKDIRLNIRWISDVLNQWESIKKKIPGHSFYELKFENLIDNFQSNLKKLCDFLNIQFHVSLLDTDISRHNIGRWKKELCEEEIKHIHNNYKFLLDRYGYK
ncbi:MAG: sulfotransferase [Candidatus Odinarchaeota archaeon]